MSMRWGPQTDADGTTTFTLWAPDRDEVTLELDTAGVVAAVSMARRDDGWFSATAPCALGTRYRFRLAPDLVVPDPASRGQADGVHGWSVLTDPAGYTWQCNAWQGRPWTEAVIQEVHVGAMGGFTGVAQQLPRLAKLGITAVQLMPVGDFSGSRGWGYDGVLPYAIAPAYGTPDALKALVDTAHALGVMVFLDVVYNHFGPDGNYLGSYAGAFFDTGKQTPWGGAVAVQQLPVRDFFIDNAMMWLDEFRIDGLRFDAVHAIDDTAFLDEMATRIRERFADVHKHLVLENEANDAARLTPALYDAQWNDDFHNVLHVLLTGETEAYYAGFADNPTGKLACCLAQGFVYQGEQPPGATHARGTKSGHLPPTAFVSFLQNHDQIGNRAMGERLTQLVSKTRLCAATALLLLCPQIPLLFMGDETGSTTPFLFFTDFTEELADAVREGRRREFAGFAAFANAADRARIPDPNAQASFAASIPEPGPDAAEWTAFYSALIALRHRYVVPRLKGARNGEAALLGTGAVHAFWHMADGAALNIAINIGPEPVAFPAIPDPFFVLGNAGAPGSFAAGLA
ncbi:malto-oligosyltrehalose trehalohydrolase [Croceicoccus sp. F390]|uniref:Malto-oligosyltrehalose trehalohydrolase n=1 Tax=Croceicoccus esteveae TaxID=3075597 RepID=A0ABU2ZJY0_9SPHN|nr:malto-oligosyltrehalose trehalohydrolase [Croceicoccus sp. F390]MDT0575702.1 malto-oligosyltrehalose trehalohydrolase [Croceicoccus sp. F390]